MTMKEMEEKSEGRFKSLQRIWLTRSSTHMVRFRP